MNLEKVASIDVKLIFYDCLNSYATPYVMEG